MSQVRPTTKVPSCSKLLPVQKLQSWGITLEKVKQQVLLSAPIAHHHVADAGLEDCKQK